MKKIPDWIPERVLIYYENLHDSREKTDQASSHYKICKKLIFDNRMKSVWSALSRRTMDEYYYILFCDAVVEGKIGLVRWHKMSLGEKDECKKKITSLAKELALQITNSPLGRLSLLDYWPSQYQEELLEKMTVNTGLNFPILLSISQPTMVEFLHAISAKAEEINIQDAILKRPNIQAANQLFFIRIVGKFMIDMYGTPLYESVATTATVILNNNVTKDKVRYIIKPLLNRG